MGGIGNKKVMSDNLLYYLGRFDISQKELADAINVAPSTVSEWVQGNKYPRIDKIELMANYFGILKSDLIEVKNVGDIPEEADFHAKILMDKDVINMLRAYYSLSDREQQIVRNFVHGLKSEA